MKYNIKDVIEKFKEITNKKYLKLKYNKKCKKLNISDNMLEGLLERLNMEEVRGILDIINESNDREEFKNKIVEYCKNRKNIYITSQFLFGNIVGNYSVFDVHYFGKNRYNYDNFSDRDYKNTLKVLRDRFYEYLLTNNEIKNNFLIDEQGTYNYTLDLNKELCLKMFDDAVNGKKSDSNINYSQCYSVIKEYINDMIGIYGKEIIEKDFDFIIYDLNGKNNLSLEERRKKYLDEYKLNSEQKYKIDNIEELISKLKTINTEKSKELLERINNIKNRKSNISEIEDIYMEYEILLREDILSHLYVPEKDYVIVEDYKNLKPQLLHMFLRNTEKFRSDIENKILNDIIQKRTDKNNTSTDLSEEEQAEYQKRMGLANAMLDPTAVNYSYDGREFVYSDKDGFNFYHSDTSNQISASIYSEKYYLNYYLPWQMGIGFNKETMTPEAIALSSPKYLTTNKGLNNLEYDQSKGFELMSSTYSELIKNDGKSEVVIFRRNIDYDTKASYVFITIDSTNHKKSEEIINKAKEMSEKNNLKLVIYDLYKIKKSYQESLLQTSDIENKEVNHKSR